MQLEATSYAPPEDSTVMSANGQYSLSISADSGLHQIRKGQDILWSFERDVWHHDYFLSDNGQFVLWVAWSYITEESTDEPAIILYSTEGAQSKWSYREVSEPRRYQEGEIGPLGDSWRIWREGITTDGDTVVIEVVGREPFSITLSTPNAKDEQEAMAKNDSESAAQQVSKVLKHEFFVYSKSIVSPELAEFIDASPELFEQGFVEMKEAFYVTAQEEADLKERDARGV